MKRTKKFMLQDRTVTCRSKLKQSSKGSTRATPVTAEGLACGSGKTDIETLTHRRRKTKENKDGAIYEGETGHQKKTRKNVITGERNDEEMRRRGESVEANITLRGVERKGEPAMTVVKSLSREPWRG